MDELSFLMKKSSVANLLVFHLQKDVEILDLDLFYIYFFDLLA